MSQRSHVSRIVFVIVVVIFVVFVFAIVFLVVRSCLLFTKNKCLKGHKSQRLLCVLYICVSLCHCLGEVFSFQKKSKQLADKMSDCFDVCFLPQNVSQSVSQQSSEWYCHQWSFLQAQSKQLKKCKKIHFSKTYQIILSTEI